MKKVLLIYGALVVIIIAVVILRLRGIDLIPKIGGGDSTVKLNNQTFEIEVADQPEEQIKGLSGRDKLDENKGMLFVFDQKAKHGFWMKNVKFPLDLIYISDNKVVDIVKNAEPKKEGDTNIPILMPRENANYVLEINGGLSDKHNFEIGNEVVFENIK